MQIEFLDADLVDQVVNFTLMLVCEKNARFDLSTSEAARTGLLHIDIDCRTYSLTGNLHQSELRQGEDVVTCAVGLHVLAHALIEDLPVFRLVHVDEVNDDDSAHVAKAQLSCQFVGSS